MFGPIRWAISALSTLVMLYVFFFVPIGHRTLYDHFHRISATPEARDLGHDIGTAGEQVMHKAEHEIEQGLTPAADAGAGSFVDPITTSPAARPPSSRHRTR